MVPESFLYWLCMYLPDQVITFTDALRSKLIRYLGINPYRVIFIPNGIPVDDYYKPMNSLDCRKRFGISSSDFVFTYTGRLVEGKYLDYFLQAASEVLKQKRKVKLLIVGDGSLNSFLQSLSNDLGIASHVIFAGFCDDIPNILATTDIFVLPSLTEGLPLSVMEAMAACKAVIATPVGGVTELIQDKINWLLVPSGNPLILTKAILDLINNRQRCEELAYSARDHAVKNFDIQSNVKAYDQLYRTNLAVRKSL